MDTVTITGQEVFSSGGPFNGDFYTDADLDAMVDAFNQVGFKPPIKLGHADGQEQLKNEEYRKIFGAPALGQIGRIYRRGRKLFADFVNVPKHLADLINRKAYSRISAEIFWRYCCNATGKTFPRVLKAVSLLGAETPAITSLKDVQALYHQTSAGRVVAHSVDGEYRTYVFDKEHNMRKQDLENWRIETSHTAISQQVSDRIQAYAVETGQEYAAAAKQVLVSARKFQEESSTPSANELA